MMARTEQIDESKKKSILEQLDVLARRQHGNVPGKDNTIGTVCLYGSGSVLDYQPDGLVLRYGEDGTSRTKTLEITEYKMGSDGKLRLESFGSPEYLFADRYNKPKLSTRDIILKGIATKRISDYEMGRIRQANEKGRFTDWNQSLLMEIATQIYNQGQPLGSDEALGQASAFFDSLSK